ncbi:hypothetical protein KC19_2G008800, partial [Ceratodon purpureus]
VHGQDSLCGAYIYIRGDELLCGCSEFFLRILRRALWSFLLIYFAVSFRNATPIHNYGPSTGHEANFAISVHCTVLSCPVRKIIRPLEIATAKLLQGLLLVCVSPLNDEYFHNGPGEIAKFHSQV